MNLLFDTNIIIDVLRGKYTLENEYEDIEKSISLITYGELFYGAYKSKDPQRSIREVNRLFREVSFHQLGISQEIMNKFGAIKANLELAGNRLDDFDIVIAATAMVHDLTLLTRNKKHFKRIKGLDLL